MKVPVARVEKMNKAKKRKSNNVSKRAGRISYSSEETYHKVVIPQCTQAKWKPISASTMHFVADTINTCVNSVLMDNDNLAIQDVVNNFQLMLQRNIRKLSVPSGKIQSYGKHTAFFNEFGEMLAAQIQKAELIDVKIKTLKSLIEEAEAEEERLIEDLENREVLHEDLDFPEDFQPSHSDDLDKEAAFSMEIFKNSVAEIAPLL